MAEGEEDAGAPAITTIYAALKPLDDKTRIHVLDYVVKRLEMKFELPGSEPDKPRRAPEPERERSAETGKILDLRTLAETKNPRTVNEKVAVVAYYLKNHAPAEERRDYIISDDIGTYFVQADFELPTAPPNMTLTHAKNAGYLNQMERGNYRLNPVGHNLVAHKLPAAEGGKSPGKRAVKKKTAKKKKAR